MVELKPKFFEFNGWSSSRHKLWSQCNRAYYYQYIATYVTGPQSFDVSRIYDLRRLDSKIFLQGSLIHNVIKNQIGQHKLGRELNIESAINQYISGIEKKQEFARDLFIEYRNGELVDTAFFERIKKEGIEQIKTFFRVIWPNFKELEYCQHEEKYEKFKIDDIQVFVVPDYVSKTKSGKIVISDWKTGVDDENYEDELQIGTYVLWALDRYSIDPKDVSCELVYLKTGNMRSYSFESSELDEIKDLIREDFKKLNEDYSIDAFPPSPSSRTCLSCKFAEICGHQRIDLESVNRTEADPFDPETILVKKE